MLVAIDIETAAAPGYEGYEKAALDHHRNRITKIAYACEDMTTGCFNTVGEFNDWLGRLRCIGEPQFIGHNFKFDLKTLITKGAELTLSDYHHDTQLQAVASCDKIPERWLAEYEVKRTACNLKAGQAIHREAGQYSLKTLAPYHLGVEPFWEVADHANEDYAIKDALYTLKLFQWQQRLLEKNHCQSFYLTKLMPWARMILNAELRGVAIDLDAMRTKYEESAHQVTALKGELEQIWAEPIKLYQQEQIKKLKLRYVKLYQQQAVKKKAGRKLRERYRKLYEAALPQLEPFNPDSPTQMMWLLKEHFKLNVTTFEGDESTGKSVLKRLASEGRQDLEKFLDYRQHKKLSTSFFPSYFAMQWNGRLHCNFNLNGTRTGRLSSNEPNLQQVPGNLHHLFVAPPGRKLLCYDLSNIEPILIAYATECPMLCEIVLRGRNFHDVNTQVFFELEGVADSEIKVRYARERKVSKELGLLLLYGGGWRRIQESAQKHGFTWTESECKSKYRRFRQTYRAVFNYKQKLDTQLEEGYAVKNLMGRYYKIPNRDDVYMKGFNTFIQGSASDLLLESGRRAWEEYEKQSLDAAPILFVHDELLIDCASEHAERCEAILLEKLLGYTLNTVYGAIQLKAEGGIYDYWKK
jgi:DNA polymerase I-like protein with 3'-5' exonuclease and polymerase domains